MTLDQSKINAPPVSKRNSSTQQGDYSMSTGWVKLHRKILDNAIFKNDKLFRVFMYLLLKASHSERDQLIGDSIVRLNVGQWATGRNAISRDTGLTEQNVRTAISKLEKLDILTIKVTVKYSIFSISNWDSYQQDNQQVTNSQPTSNQQVTTNNKVKNLKNEKNKDLCQQIANAWNDTFKDSLPTVLKVTPKRKAAINGCIEEMKSTEYDFSLLETWQRAFDYAKGIKFLMGENDRGWTMGFDFIITKSSLIKLVEGGYQNDN